MKLFFLFISLLTVSAIKPIPDFRTPKNIAFGSSGGGSSHHLWVFEILKELNIRGHNVSFYSRADQLRFANDYPMVGSKQVGSLTDLLHHPLVLKHLTSHPDPLLVYSSILHSSMIDYPQEFLEYGELFESEKIDLVICDAFAVSCVDRAMVSNLPVIISTTIGTFSDDGKKYINNQPFTSVDPSTQYESLWIRIFRRYILYPTFLQGVYKKVDYALAFQRKFGLLPSIDVSTSKYNDVPKIINNLFGIETARSHSPLVHMIGPVMRADYPALDTTTLNFLNCHNSVAYIAFGQHAVPSSNDVQMIMQTLISFLELNIIDGIIWAHLNKDQLPSHIKTPTNIFSSFNISHHQHIYLPTWAPQFAILQHLSTSFFISHGGVGSLHEALYSRKRLFIYPFFGDQPTNAKSIERTGLGKYFDATDLSYTYKDYQRFYEKLYTVAADPQHEIQDRVNRYSAYVQVSSENAVARGADILEESLFASNKQGRLNYRRDAGYDIHWIKRNDLDIYAASIILCLISFKIGYMIYIMSESKYRQLHKKKCQTKML